MTDSKADNPDTTKPATISMEDFAELVRRANAGDDEALAELRFILDECEQIWQQVGDLGKHAEMAMIKLISNGNKLIAESLARKAADMRLQLAGPDPSPLEQICVQRIVATWLELQWTETTFPEPTGKTLDVQKFVLKRKDSAERRFSASVKSLMLVRKLLPHGNGPKAKVHLWPDPEEIVAGVIGEDTSSHGKRKTGSHRKPKDVQVADYFAEEVGSQWAPINRITSLYELESTSRN
jgi:hypothetical protein